MKFNTILNAYIISYYITPNAKQTFDLHITLHNIFPFIANLQDFTVRIEMPWK